MIAMYELTFVRMTKLIEIFNVLRKSFLFALNKCFLLSIAEI